MVKADERRAREVEVTLTGEQTCSVMSDAGNRCLRPIAWAYMRNAVINYNHNPLPVRQQVGVCNRHARKRVKRGQVTLQEVLPDPTPSKHVVIVSTPRVIHFGGDRLCRVRLARRHIPRD